MAAADGVGARRRRWRVECRRRRPRRARASSDDRPRRTDGATARRRGGRSSAGLSHGSPIRPSDRDGPVRPRRRSAATDVAFLTGCRLDPESAARYCSLGRTHKVLSSLPPTGGADWAGASGLSVPAPDAEPRAEPPVQAAVSESRRMELTWYGRTCVRLRGQGRGRRRRTRTSRSSDRPGAGITGDIVTFSHPDDTPLPRAKGKRSRDGLTLLPIEPGGRVRPRRAGRVRGQGRPASPASGPIATTPAAPRRGKQVAFVVELDGMHTIHLGDIGHLLTEEKLGDIGVGRHRLRPARRRRSAPTKAAALDRPARPADRRPDAASARTRPTAPRRSRKFFHEMGAEPSTQPKLSVTRSRACRPRRRRSCSSRAASRSDRRRRTRGHGAIQDDPAALDRRSGRGPRPASTGSGPWSGRARSTRSAALPGSSDPISSSSPSAWAALIVTAARASSGRHPQVRGRRRSWPAAGSRVGDVPGIEVRADARPGRPRSMNVRAGRVVVLHQEPGRGRAGASRRPAGPVGGGRGQGVDAGVRRSREVVGRRRPELGGQLGAAGRRELVGVEARRQAVCGRRLRGSGATGPR